MALSLPPLALARSRARVQLGQRLLLSPPPLARLRHERHASRPRLAPPPPPPLLLPAPSRLAAAPLPLAGLLILSARAAPRASMLSPLEQPPDAAAAPEQRRGWP
ncbi:hypothetical protein AB1Y20_007625 [Prymnesium parvum]|uniref:Uncharacterized protein n=1 Tax=Prymnesium parvum TaxID=97485 RepID=A0AB34IY85_PRYPA